MCIRIAALLLAIVVVVRADLYMQNPPGSNDRNRERNDNRNNANRMFDSQNNAAGGSAWKGDATFTTADPITYYHGSKLRIEWTAQHQCGSGDQTKQDVHCQLIVQYACENDMPALRDGYPEGAIVESDNNNAGYKRRAFSGRGGQNADGTERIPDDRTDAEFYNPGLLGGIEFGYHESIASYRTCKTTSRNKGLYTSDQKLQGNDARFTRQNPNGGRRGLECPEERDYYPYWRPSQFHDLAILTSDTRWCDYYQSKSQNVAPVSYCNCNDQCRTAAPNQVIPITSGACTAAGGSWVTQQRSEPAPECLYHPFSRDNHLGNVAQVDGSGNPVADVHEPSMAHYNLDIPERMGSQLCIIRLRYNMSTEDYPAMAFATPGTASVGFDAAKNCPRITQGGTGGVDDGSGNVVDNPQCTTSLTLNSRPLYNRPYVQVFDSTDPKLALAINTHQTGRTFQDRTYVFRVGPKPDGISGTIWNLNLRGRRGNIVQAYPCVEYDFVPKFLSVGNGDFLHIQIHGSDFNEAKNANNGEGWQYSDRSNIVQSESMNLNYPLFKSQISMFQSLDIAKRWALLEQDPATCKPYKDGDANEQNAIDNCGKLNRAPARFPPNPASGLVQMGNAGTFHYFSSRNNNFSNRGQKATLFVGSAGLSAAAIAGIVIGSLAGAALLGAGVCFYGKRNPNTVAGSMYAKTVGRGRCFNSSGSAAAAGPYTSTASRSTPAPDMEYTRH